MKQNWANKFTFEQPEKSECSCENCRKADQAEEGLVKAINSYELPYAMSLAVVIDLITEMVAQGTDTPEALVLTTEKVLDAIKEKSVRNLKKLYKDEMLTRLHALINGLMKDLSADRKETKH